MGLFDTEQLNQAAQQVIGCELPSTQNIFSRLNELEPPQGRRIDGIAKNLQARGMDKIAAEQMALGVGLGILLMAEATEI